jgi:hypothetical protein
MKPEMIEFSAFGLVERICLFSLTVVFSVLALV